MLAWALPGTTEQHSPGVILCHIHIKCLNEKKKRKETQSAVEMLDFDLELNKYTGFGIC